MRFSARLIKMALYYIGIFFKASIRDIFMLLAHTGVPRICVGIFSYRVKFLVTLWVYNAI